MRGQVGGEAGVEGVALVVVDGGVVGAEVAGGISGIGAGEAADDVAALLGNLVRISKVELAEAGEARGADGGLPCADERAVDGDGEVDVGLADVGVVEEVVDTVAEGVDVDGPLADGAGDGDLDAELMLLVALRGERDEGVFARLAGDVIEEGAGDGLDGCGLEESAVKAAEDPVDARNAEGCADAGIGDGLSECGALMRDAHATHEGEPGAELKAVREVTFNECCACGGGCVGDGVGGVALVIDDEAEEVVFTLVEGVKAGGEVVGAGDGAEIGLRTDVIGGLVPGGGDWCVGGR